VKGVSAYPSPKLMRPTTLGLNKRISMCIMNPSFLRLTMSFCEQIERRDYIWLSACPVVANAAYEQLQLSGRTGRMVNVGCGMRDAAMI